MNFYMPIDNMMYFEIYTSILKCFGYYVNVFMNFKN